MNQER